MTVHGPQLTLIHRGKQTTVIAGKKELLGGLIIIKSQHNFMVEINELLKTN